MPESPAPAPPKKRRGLFCPRCSSNHLPVIKTTLPCLGVRIRYHACVDCGCRIVTGEKILRWSYPIPADAKAAVAKLKKGCR